MCGRYVRKDNGQVVFSYFEINDIRIPWKPDFNVAPTRQVPVVRQEGDVRALLELRWGLIPAWAKEGDKLPMMINARAETVATKPSYRSAFKRRRCLVPAAGYYEWKKLPDGTKQPYFFQRKDGKPIAFAGIWEGETVATITTAPNPEAAAIHDRMPVMLEPADWPRYLAEEPLTDAERAEMLAPLPAGVLDICPVDRRVGSVKFNDPSLIEPL